jgi:hypothetical protein
MADIEDLCIRTVPEKVFHDVFKQFFAACSLNQRLRLPETAIFIAEAT